MDRLRWRSLRPTAQFALALCLTFTAQAHTGSPLAAEAYKAVLCDETEVTGNRLLGWFPRTKPSLDGKALFEDENPVRLLYNTTLARSSIRPPYVVMSNGDVVPGSVEKYDARSSKLESPELIVSLLRPLQALKSNKLRVRADCVRCIVHAGPVSNDLAPGTLILHRGGSVKARSLRWTADGVIALSESAVVKARFDEIAQLDIPSANPIAGLKHDGHGAHGLIARMETNNSAVLTYPRAPSASVVVDDRVLGYLHRRGYDLGDAIDRGWNLTRRRRFLFFSLRRRGTTEKRLEVVRPAWSLERIVVPNEAVNQRGYRNADEIPLSLLPAMLLSHECLVCPNLSWRRNQNLHGEALVSGGLRADLGIATRSHSEIAFQLPPGAQEFSSWVGIDRSVGSGGCVRCKVFLGDEYGAQISGDPVWTSAFLRGGDRPEWIAPIDVSRAAQVVLVTEYGHYGRPDGSDPLDIRDEVDWLLPKIRLDSTTFYDGS